MAARTTPKGRKPVTTRTVKTAKSGSYKSVTFGNVVRHHSKSAATMISVNRKARTGVKPVKPTPSIVALVPATDAEAHAQINELIKENKSVLDALAKL